MIILLGLLFIIALFISNATDGKVGILGAILLFYCMIPIFGAVGIFVIVIVSVFWFIYAIFKHGL